MDLKQMYLDMYKEWRGHLRHHEAQRSTLTNICLVLTGGTFGFIASRPITRLTILPSSFLFISGVTGLLLAQKLYERMQHALVMTNLYQAALDGLTVGQLDKSMGDLRQSKKRIGNWQRRFDVLRSLILAQKRNVTLPEYELARDPGALASHSQLSLTALTNAARETQQLNYPDLFKVKLHIIWNTFFLLVSVVGIVLTLVACFMPEKVPAK